GDHDSIQTVGVRQGPALSSEQQLTRRDRVFGLDLRPPQLGQPRPDRDVVDTLFGQLAEQTEYRFFDHPPRVVAHLRTSLGSPSRWSAMMPRWISAVPPMMVAALEYHQSARTVSSSVRLETGSPPSNRVRCTSKTRSLTSRPAVANNSLSRLLSGPTVSPAASLRTVLAHRAV